MGDIFELKKTVYISGSFDPVENLGFEEYLVSICEKDEVIMYLWQNRKTIVIGKHQNPYKECNIGNLKKDGIHLVRRRSGGGAVFHDLGNLNFTFIAQQENYDQDRHFSVILKALSSWGIEAAKTGRNDITVDGRKFSGNAFMYKKNIRCHHGTLLVDVNMKELGTYLTPPQIKLIGKGVDSVRARVVNLKELNEDLTIEGLKKTLTEAFDQTYPGTLTSRKMPDKELYADFCAPFSDWNWTIAKSPKATMSHSGRFEWGTLVMDLSITGGTIESCIISSDSLLDQPFEDFAESITGLKLRVKDIENVVDNLFTDRMVLKDLKDFMEEFL